MPKILFRTTRAAAYLTTTGLVIGIGILSALFAGALVPEPAVPYVIGIATGWIAHAATFGRKKST